MLTTLETPLAERLHCGALELGVTLDGGQERQLLDYLALLLKWSAVYNLTALREPSQILTHHLLDSLAVVPILERLAPARVMDVGSGAGLPGVVLAIAMPQLRVTLVDAVQKKTAFLTQVKAQLGLPLTIVHGRVEALTFEERYDCIVSRAFASLGEMIRLTAAHLAPTGVYLAMKGDPTAEEMGELPAPWQIREVLPLQVPQLHAARCAIVLGRTGCSPA